jgi:glycosyltransferase involved in cell wall biosynthesis
MKVCMVAYTFYETDARVRRYAEALAERGDQVDVVALQSGNAPDTEVLRGVRVFRIQKRKVNERSKYAYLVRLFAFMLRSFWLLSRENMRGRYQLIHVHSVPDFEVFAALVPKLTGAKIILDIHDIVPEFYASKFRVGKNSLVFKVLTMVERLSASFSDHVIAANHIWEERLLQRSVAEGKCTTILNFPDDRVFAESQVDKKANGKCIILYPGTINHHQGLDLAVKALAKIKDDAPEAEFHIYGTGDRLESLSQLIVEMQMQDRVILKGPVPLEEIARVIATADIGVVPKRKDGFGNEAFSTKILEFMALHVPVIAPDSMVDRHYFNDSIVQFFHGNDEDSLAEAMLRLIKDPALRKELSANASVFVRSYMWDHHKGSYLNLVDRLVNSSLQPRAQAHSDSTSSDGNNRPFSKQDNSSSFTHHAK